MELDFSCIEATVIFLQNTDKMNIKPLPQNRRFCTCNAHCPKWDTWEELKVMQNFSILPKLSESDIRTYSCKNYKYIKKFPKKKTTKIDEGPGQPVVDPINSSKIPHADKSLHYLL